MQIQIDKHRIPGVEKLKQFDSVQRPAKACELKLQMMTAIGAMKIVQVLDDNGKLIQALSSYQDVDKWVNDNVATGIEQYIYIESNVLPKWGAT